MAIVQQNSGNSGTGQATSANVTLPSNTTPDNTLFIAIMVVGGTNVTAAGFTQDKEATFTGTAARLRLFRKTAVTESSWTVDFGGTNSSFDWYAWEEDGLDPNPVDVSAATNGGSSSVTTRSTGTTAQTAQPAALAVALGGSTTSAGAGAGVTFSGQTNGFAAGEVHDGKSAHTTNRNASMYVARKELAARQTVETTATQSASQLFGALVVVYRKLTIAPVVRSVVIF